MQAQQQQKPYTIENESQFPFLTNIGHFQKAKLHGQQQKSWNAFLIQSGPLFNKWFNWTGPEFILVEMDQKNRSVKFYEQHSSVKYLTKFSQRKVKGSLILSEVRNFNQKIEIDVKKNFTNGALSPAFTYNWINYNQLEAQSELNRVMKFGIQFDLKKWLSNSLTTNEKKVFFKLQNHIKIPHLPFQMCQSTIYLANRSNYHQLDGNNSVLGQSIVKRSSDILGYGFSAFNQNHGLQLTLNGGYDHFHSYNFNQLILKFGNFKEYEKHVIEMSIRAGTVLGKNLMQNDLLARCKSRWVDDRSVSFFNTRLNVIFKNFHPIFGGVFQIVPFFYLQGCASRNLKQSKTKLQLDYGIGLRFLNTGITLDTSLIRIGKNLDEINPSIRIIY